MTDNIHLREYSDTRAIVKRSSLQIELIDCSDLAVEPKPIKQEVCANGITSAFKDHSDQELSVGLDVDSVSRQIASNSLR